ncbi:hypothetical protein [Halorhabdus amylolytica]|uniref:hypothetical protein n=1 Tax=Halorhabdus amylolytica TaxID=2559573 RepID=UPI0010AB1BD8|nr:hypothetical protein [Halorhabdus amylolytica]
MAQNAHKETDLYTMEYDEEIDAVVFYWEAFSTGEQFRDGANDLLAFIKEQDARKLIVNTRGIKAHNEEDQQWLLGEWLPKVIDAGIEYDVTVHRDSVISQMDMEEFYEEMSDLDFESMVTADMDEAREWIAER